MQLAIEISHLIALHHQKGSTLGRFWTRLCIGNTVKSCIKIAVYVQFFQLFAAASIPVWLFLGRLICNVLSLKNPHKRPGHYTSWCRETASLTSLDAHNFSGASSDVKEPISLHQAVQSVLVTT